MSRFDVRGLAVACIVERLANKVDKVARALDELLRLQALD